MAIELKVLGFDSVPLTGSDPYEVPAAKSAVISTISLVNTDTNFLTVIIYAVVGGVARRISELAIAIPAGAQALFQDVITLGAGDKVRITASVGGKLDAVAFGVERDE